MRKKASEGLYTPTLEHDACGIGFLANINGTKAHSVLADALSMLENMEHRGGRGSSAKTGDGAGVLLQIPHEFFLSEAERCNLTLPEPGQYGVGMIFFPRDKRLRQACKEVLQNIAHTLQLTLIGYRPVPVNHHVPGPGAAEVEPRIEQLFVKPLNEWD